MVLGTDLNTTLIFGSLLLVSDNVSAVMTRERQMRGEMVSSGSIYL